MSSLTAVFQDPTQIRTGGRGASALLLVRIIPSASTKGCGGDCGGSGSGSGSGSTTSHSPDALASISGSLLACLSGYAAL